MLFWPFGGITTHCKHNTVGALYKDDKGPAVNHDV